MDSIVRDALMKTRVLATILTCACATPVFAAKLTINAGEEPDEKAWTKPASVNYVNNANSNDSWSVDLAAKVEGQPAASLPVTAFLRAVVQRNTETKKPVENYVAEVGGKFDLPQWGNTFLLGQASIAFSDKTNFPDSKADCSITPLPTACIRQRERSIRPAFTVQPFRSSWENTFAYSDSQHTQLVGPTWTHSILPVISLFYDDVLDAKLNGAGVESDGGVFGSKAILGVAFSPKVTNYRLIISGGVQLITAFNRSNRRKADFAASSTLSSASATYEFGPRSFEGGTGWVPSIGVTYTKGDDPLAGKKDIDNVTFGFKITYKSE
jgi:hypothetical protein